MTVPCATTPCDWPAGRICEHCLRKLCVVCYGSGSSSRCARCWAELRLVPQSVQAPA